MSEQNKPEQTHSSNAGVSPVATNLPENAAQVEEQEMGAVDLPQEVAIEESGVDPRTVDEHQEAAPARQEKQHADGGTRVVIHNDDVTPYEFVLFTLNDIFLLSEEIAEHVAWTAHTRGAAVVVIRPRPEAEKLVKAAHARAKFNGFPLTFSIEAES